MPDRRFLGMDNHPGGLETAHIGAFPNGVDHPLLSQREGLDELFLRPRIVGRASCEFQIRE